MREKISKSVNHWFAASAEYIAVDLFVLAILWDNAIAIPTIVPLTLIVSFLIFTTTMSANSVLIHLNGIDVPEEKIAEHNKKIRRTNSLAEISYGFAFTLLLCALTITAYVINEKDILFSVAIIIAAWLNMLFYTIALKGKIFNKRLIWVLIELVVLIFLFLDYQEIMIWI